MKQSLLIILLCSLILGCKPQSQNHKPNVKSTSVSQVDSIKTKLTETSINHSAETNPLCDCESFNYTRNYSTDLRFQNSEYRKSENEDLYNKWSQDSLVNDVKSIRFSGFDTIPNKYSVFKNVERLSIENRNGIYGLDIFPNLSSVHFFGSIINLDSNENWLNKLEVLIGQKTKFHGLESFRKAPNLKVIYMGFSGFEEFPEDLESLDCLSELTLGAYMFGEINLNQFDLSKNKCLKKLVIQTWYNSLSGIPNGILASNIKEVIIDHQKLTESEKKELDKIKSQLAIKYNR